VRAARLDDEHHRRGDLGERLGVDRAGRGGRGDEHPVGAVLDALQQVGHGRHRQLQARVELPGGQHGHVREDRGRVQRVGQLDLAGEDLAEA